ncbi:MULTISPECIES: MBL fold metallo-hydrolase [unclassified Streptomyces]|uniref:MBL fold metallo-hydrolase n=1 Tax=unclassified Streptomyces TaxID=2593676 RepID=UPI0035D8CFB5
MENVTTVVTERELVQHRLAAEVVDAWSTREIGLFRVTAVSAVDGLGDPQLNWVVQADGQRVFQGGDTMFHGCGWLVARRFSPFDAVFLPADVAEGDAPHLRPPSPLPAALDPRQAAAAAEILDAWYAVPMHYDTEQPDRSRAPPKSPTRRTSPVRTPEGARMCWPSEHGWTWPPDRCAPHGQRLVAVSRRTA